MAHKYRDELEKLESGQYWLAPADPGFIFGNFSGDQQTIGPAMAKLAAEIYTAIKDSVEAKLPPAWVLLLAALGLPTAAAVKLSDWALANPWSALGLLAAWCFLVGLGGFALKLWAKRESVVIDWFLEWVDRALLRLFSPGRRVYLAVVAERCLALRREGIINRRAWSFRLDEVFVDLRLVPKPESEASAAIVSPGPKQILAGRRSLWALLDRGPDQPLRLAVLGGPGTGKSTLLEHVALRLAVGRGQPIPRRLRHRVPILIALRDHSIRILKEANITPSALVTTELPASDRPGRTGRWLDHQLDCGHALVMIDGLDEVADAEARKAIVTWVSRQIRTYRQCAFILTSRPPPLSVTRGQLEMSQRIALRGHLG